MKKLIVSVLLIAAGFTVNAQKFDSFGEKIKEKNAISATQLPSKMQGQEKLETKVTGTVESVCQAKGCWMKIKLDNGETMRVTFKDYGFFVPKDIAGKTVVVEGEAKIKETSVNELRHYAEDAGKSKEEIEKINAPKKELTFVADGVLVSKN